MARRKKEGAEASVATEPPPNGDETTGAEERTQPVHRIRIRNVSGAIWQNSRQDGTTYLTFTVSRTYRDEQQNWHSSGSFGAPDGFLLAEVARQCALWIVAQTQGETPF
jgi:hypothetical protein